MLDLKSENEEQTINTENQWKSFHVNIMYFIKKLLYMFMEKEQWEPQVNKLEGIHAQALWIAMLELN